MRIKNILLFLLIIIFCSSCGEKAGEKFGGKLFPENFHADALYTNKFSDVLAGNPQGDITIVYFSDYFCLPCRIMSLELDKLVKQNKNIRVIYKEFPIMDRKSNAIAAAIIAAGLQKKAKQLHDVVMQNGEILNREQLFQIASGIGIDVAKLKVAINSQQVLQSIINNMVLGNAFNITGLPTLIIGRTKYPHHTTLFSGLSASDLKLVIEGMSL